jgi:protein LTV1
VIIATYSNLENHPRLLKLTQSKGTKKILLDSKTGLPTVVEKDKEAKVKSRHSSDTDESSEGEGEEEEGEVKSGKSLISSDEFYLEMRLLTLLLNFCYSRYR